MNYSWEDGATIAEHRLLSGTVFYRSPFWSASTAYRAGEPTASLVTALGLWWLSSLTTALVFLALDLLLSVRRPHFFDVGRFTAGIWPVSPTARAPIIGLGWMLHGEDRTAPKAGLELVIGRVSVAAYALMRRKEWAEYKLKRAKGLAGMVD
ncbi:hypothetical protein ABZ612_20455 [Streptomyces avermitilis]|uniref:hypothetical protein n=1 Tax=Streptomyces avermitilis TaxID=33903 RepID=UPI0033E214BC